MSGCTATSRAFPASPDCEVDGPHLRHGAGSVRASSGIRFSASISSFARTSAHRHTGPSPPHDCARHHFTSDVPGLSDIGLMLSMLIPFGASLGQRRKLDVERETLVVVGGGPD